MVYGVGWITTVVIIRPSQPSLAGVGAGAELGNTDDEKIRVKTTEIFWQGETKKLKIFLMEGVLLPY